MCPAICARNCEFRRRGNNPFYLGPSRQGLNGGPPGANLYRWLKFVRGGSVVSFGAVVSSVAILAVCAISAAPLAQAQFETRANFSVNAPAFSLVVGDFNRDGTLDMAEVNLSADLEVMLGNGDGTFRLGTTYALPANAFYAATASLRNNGILDLVVGAVNADDVYVLLGNGDGTFQSPAPYPTTAAPAVILLGDFTGDGKIDVLAAEEHNTQGGFCGCVEVLPGKGDGTFGPPITTTVPYGITGYSIASGDFNNDGKLDVAVGGGLSSTNQIDILLGNGNGTFTSDGFYSVGGPIGNIATGYFTGNKKKIDLAVTNELALGVLLGNGNGTFQSAAYYDTYFPTWVIAEDFSGDGKTDLAASNGGIPPTDPPGVSVFNGNGSGTFQAGVFYPVGSEEGGDFVAAGDFNGDGKPDLVVVNEVNGIITTLLNTGVVSFSPTTPVNFKKQAVGTTSAPQTVTLTNTGTTELKIQSMKASAAFAMTSTCGTRVAPGANCTISATFSPTKQGAKQGTISIVDNASSKPQVIELLGTGD